MIRPRAIFWDWDGTLVDSCAFLHGVHNRVRADLGRAPISRDAFMGHFGAPRAQLYTDLYGPENYDNARELFDIYVTQGHRTGALKPLPDAQMTLQVASGLNLPMGVVSNKRPAFLRAEAAQFGWAHHFQVMVGAGEAAADKPDAGPLLLALERANMTHGCDVWLVGDTDNDVQCAVAAGCTAVFVGPDAPPGTHQHYSDLAALRAALAGLYTGA